jgi:glycosyltransferase involved in cell wall biosynthesis
MRLSILITNGSLEIPSGTTTVTRDLALGLVSRGHQAMVYSARLGPIAEELRRSGVVVCASLSDIPTRPDIIHGHHHGVTTAAVVFFRTVPALFVCHDANTWYDHPPRIARIRRYVGVDSLRHARLMAQPWMSPQQVLTIHNGVDTTRFRWRQTPLPKRPRRALLFSHHATRSNFGGQMISICQRLNLRLDVLGQGFGHAVIDPENYLSKYDLVFAVGLSAMEAMATGASCILCDHEGLGPLVATDNIRSLQTFNFGHSLLNEPLSPETLAQRVEAYDADDAIRVHEFVRTNVNIDRTITQYVELYEQILQDTDHFPEFGEDIRTYAATICSELNTWRAVASRMPPASSEQMDTHVLSAINQ